MPRDQQVRPMPTDKDQPGMNEDDRSEDGGDGLPAGEGRRRVPKPVMDIRRLFLDFFRFFSLELFVLEVFVSRSTGPIVLKVTFKNASRTMRFGPTRQFGTVAPLKQQLRQTGCALRRSAGSRSWSSRVTILSRWMWQCKQPTRAAVVLLSGVRWISHWKCWSLQSRSIERSRGWLDRMLGSSLSLMGSLMWSKQVVAL